MTWSGSPYGDQASGFQEIVSPPGRTFLSRSLSYFFRAEVGDERRASRYPTRTRFRGFPSQMDFTTEIDRVPSLGAWKGEGKGAGGWQSDLMLLSLALLPAWALSFNGAGGETTWSQVESAAESLCGEISLRYFSGRLRQAQVLGCSPPRKGGLTMEGAGGPSDWRGYKGGHARKGRWGGSCRMVYCK